MLQSILRRTVCTNLSTVSNVKCSTSCDIILKKDINRVKLVGTVIVGQFKVGRGQKFMKVKTTDFDGKNEQIHLLYTTVPYDYEAGQRVFVDGRLSSKDVATFENKRLFKPIVYAFRIYALDSMTEDKTKPKDVNSVQLIASVYADILNEDDHSFIQAITHHRHKTLQENRCNFHVIFVFDQNLREFVRNNLEKNDRIYVRGSLSSTHIDTNGNRSQSGYIVAQSIQKIIIR